MRDPVELLRELMALRPVSADVARVNQAVEAIRSVLVDEGVGVDEEEIEGRRILYASTSGSRTVDVLLNAHLDVVPAEDGMFDLRENDGRLTGRGTFDCLGNCVVVARTLARLNGRGSVGAIFSTDEETGGQTTGHMCGCGVAASRLVLVLDGEGHALTVAQKGVLSLKLIATGTACHSAEPWKGDNALDKLVDGYARIRALFPTVDASDQWHDTLAATVCSAGNVHNRVPERAEMIVNIRYTTPGDGAAIVAKLRAVSGLEVATEMACDPVNFDPHTPILSALRNHMAHTFGREIPVRRLNGATDARYFAPMGVPVGIIGLPGGDPHGSGESIESGCLSTHEDMLVDFLDHSV